MKHRYIIVVKGNDTFKSETRLFADSFSDAYFKADSYIEALNRITIEKLRVFSIEEIE